MGLFSGLLGNAGNVSIEELQEEYSRLLIDGETIESGFVLIRDTFLFTSKRLILIDKQGVTGKKISYTSVPYAKITKFSVETSGHFDLDAELKIWVASELEPIQKQFSKKVDIYEVQRILASHC